MEYCITVSCTYTRAFTVEVEDDAAAEKYADELVEKLSNAPDGINDGYGSWDYAVDQNGRDVVRWSE